MFEHVPDAGSWGTALLLDGNIGIGGEPAALLGRARELLAPGGAVLAELDPPGALERRHARAARGAGRRERVVPVGAAWASTAVEEVAAEAGLARDWTMCSGGRWFAALRRS